LDKIEQQARAAKADADAQNDIIDGAPMRLQTMRAELEKVRADSDQARADADAATQKINNIPVALAQKRADVATAEAQASEAANGVKLFLRNALNPEQGMRDMLSNVDPAKAMRDALRAAGAKQ
jgi:hypothetical protein